jgi:hypothetical protein
MIARINVFSIFAASNSLILLQMQKELKGRRITMSHRELIEKQRKD